MAKAKIDLKPCPFCGGKANIYEYTKAEAKDLVMRMHYGENEKKEAIQQVMKMPVDTWAIIGCETEDCILYANKKKHVSSLFFRETSAERIAEKWNKRPELIISIPSDVCVRTEMLNQIENARAGIVTAPAIEIEQTARRTKG